MNLFIAWKTQGNHSIILTLYTDTLNILAGAWKGINMRFDKTIWNVLMAKKFSRKEVNSADGFEVSNFSLSQLSYSRMITNETELYEIG